MDDPIALAEYVLRDDPKWSREAIVAALDSVENYTITFSSRIAVHLFYCTTYVDGVGGLMMPV